MRLLWRRRTASETDHELIWLAVSVAAIAGGAGWLALSLPWPRCPFFAVTGFPCLTCGATRSAIAFLHGDFLSALKWNPLAFVAFCGVIVFDLYAAIVLVGRLPRLRMVDWTAAEKTAVRIAAISLLALNWIYLLAHHDRF
jgi:hypothetical protein